MYDFLEKEINDLFKLFLTNLFKRFRQKKFKICSTSTEQKFKMTHKYFQEKKKQPLRLHDVLALPTLHFPNFLSSVSAPGNVCANSLPFAIDNCRSV